MQRQTRETLRWAGGHKDTGTGECYQHDFIARMMLPSAGSIDSNQLHALLQMTKKTNLPPNSRLGNNSFACLCHTADHYIRCRNQMNALINWMPPSVYCKSKPGCPVEEGGGGGGGVEGTGRRKHRLFPYNSSRRKHGESKREIILGFFHAVWCLP